MIAKAVHEWWTKFRSRTLAEFTRCLLHSYSATPVVHLFLSWVDVQSWAMSKVASPTVSASNIVCLVMIELNTVDCNSLNSHHR
mmetsp:Transcript_52832/g.139059  ORF Transcript_52832/g.139059 Transcript_52832/m.139059 type:complete len:84 (-) Transcript_52832:181-432(-)